MFNCCECSTVSGFMILSVTLKDLFRSLAKRLISQDASVQIECVPSGSWLIL